MSQITCIVCAPLGEPLVNWGAYALQPYARPECYAHNCAQVNEAVQKAQNEYLCTLSPDMRGVLQGNINNLTEVKTIERYFNRLQELREDIVFAADTFFCDCAKCRENANYGQIDPPNYDHFYICLSSENSKPEQFTLAKCKIIEAKFADTQNTITLGWQQTPWPPSPPGFTTKARRVTWNSRPYKAAMLCPYCYDCFIKKKEPPHPLLLAHLAQLHNISTVEIEKKINHLNLN